MPSIKVTDPTQECKVPRHSLFLVWTHELVHKYLWSTMPWQMLEVSTKCRFGCHLKLEVHLTVCNYSNIRSTRRRKDKQMCATISPSLTDVKCYELAPASFFLLFVANCWANSGIDWEEALFSSLWVGGKFWNLFPSFVLEVWFHGSSFVILSLDIFVFDSLFEIDNSALTHFYQCVFFCMNASDQHLQMTSSDRGH